MSLDLVDNETHQFMVLWSHAINIVLIILWVVTLATLMVITRVRNIFGWAVIFMCLLYRDARDAISRRTRGGYFLVSSALI